ncbi:MAG: hypothetical protein P8078_06040, partial [bacterium]
MEGKIIPGNSTKESCSLPIFFPPPVTTYLHHSIPLSVILTNPDAGGWFYTNYLQLCTNMKNKPPFPSENFQFFPYNFSWENTFFLEVLWQYCIDSNSIIDLIKRSVRNGLYLDFDILECWIPGTAGYQKYYNFTH